MSETPEGDDDEQRRNRVNLAAAIAVLLIAAGAIWLVKALQDYQRLENCVASGRRDCLERIEPAAGPPRSP